MGYECKILADSIASGVRLTTHLITHPRFILAEVNTHRVFSRNSASSRAIPVEKRVAAVRADPFVPEAFAANQKGMQAGEEFDAEENALVQARWLALSEHLCKEAEWFASRKVHKQWANRVVELTAWHTAIITATEFENFFALRCNPEASPEFRKIAEMMRDAMAESKPTELAVGEWHLPLVFDEDYEQAIMQRPEYPQWVQECMVKLSVARCARVSYLTHHGVRDMGADLALYDRLLTSGHMSPFEHAAKVARPSEFTTKFIGNVRAPWLQHRKQIPHEDNFGSRPK